MSAFWFTYSQTAAEAILLPQSSGTRGHEGDAFLQRDGGRFHVWPQKRSALPPVSGVCWRRVRHSLRISNHCFDCVVAHCYGIQHSESKFKSSFKAPSWCLFARRPLTCLKPWWSACTGYARINASFFFFFSSLSNHFPLVEEAHSLLLTESSSLEGFSINQVQCFTESALRTPSWRSSWGSCPPGCPCATKDGTRRWERWSADSWVI